MTISPHPPGGLVVVRTVTNGWIRYATPAVVVEDSDVWIAYVKAGLAANKVTVGAASQFPSRAERGVALRRELQLGRFELTDKVPAGRGVLTLTLARPGDWFSVRLRLDPASDAFVPDYVNIERPYQRTSIGFDTDDLCLDMVVVPTAEAFSWELKDDGDLDARHRLDIYSDADVAMIRAAAEIAVDRIERREPPFNGSWAAWRPDPGWSMPVELPPDWAVGTKNDEPS